MLSAREIMVASLGEALRQQPLSDAKVRFAWASAVGAAIARATAVKLDAAGTLHVRSHSDHWRRELERSRGTIQQRLASLLGSQAISRLVFHRSPST